MNLHIQPLIAITGYLLYPKNLQINSSLLHTLSIIHNGGLVIFSGWTFVSLSQIMYENGIIGQSRYYFQIPHFDRIIYLFYMSKYYEFFDTFLLYLNNKTPIFLQKYHHIGAVVCWHLLYVYKVDSIWIPTIANSFVHTIMYSYYLGCLLKIQWVRYIKKYITFLQLTQLTVPNCLALYLYYPPVETVFNYQLILFFFAYVCGLIGLFIQFFYKNYVKSK